MKNWYMPTQTKWLAGAAAAVFFVGLAYLNMDQLPHLAAANQAPASRILVETDIRDAVAAPAAVPGAGWFQPSAGAAYLSRSAHNPAMLDRLKAAPAPVPMIFGRKAFNSPRVIVDKVRLYRPH
ncbi:MAG: hypothetical protein WC881_07305 [Elusimicrobiota bacterium]